MDNQQQFHDEQASLGRGAARFKHGLGFSSGDQSKPSSQPSTFVASAPAASEAAAPSGQQPQSPPATGNAPAAAAPAAPLGTGPAPPAAAPPPGHGPHPAGQPPGPPYPYPPPPFTAYARPPVGVPAMPYAGPPPLQPMPPHGAPLPYMRPPPGPPGAYAPRPPPAGPPPGPYPYPGPPPPMVGMRPPGPPPHLPGPPPVGAYPAATAPAPYPYGAPPPAAPPPGPMPPPGAPPSFSHLDHATSANVRANQEILEDLARQQEKRAAEAKLQEEAEAQKRAQEEKQRRIQAAWTAHKGPDGVVYYYNTITEASSWDKPEGFVGQVAEKVDDTPVPVNSMPVEGTDWCEVKCEDGRVYFFQTETEETSWAMPPEVEEVKRKLAVVEAAKRAEDAKKRAEKEQQMREQIAAQQAYQRGRMSLQNTGGGSRGGGGRAAYQSAIAAAQSAHAAAAAARAKAEAASRFKELLMDKGVTPFSRWERELPKLESDPRWKLLNSNKDRRALFDEFCKNSAVEQKRLQAERAERVRREFAELLEEAVELEVRLMASEKRDVMLAEKAARKKKKADKEEGEEEDDGNGNGSKADKEGSDTEARNDKSTSRNGGQRRADDDSNGSSGQKAARSDADGGSDGDDRSSDDDGSDEDDDMEIEVDMDALQGEVSRLMSLEHLERYWGNDDRWKAAGATLREELLKSRFGAHRQAAEAEAKKKLQGATDAFIDMLKEFKIKHTTRWADAKSQLSGDPRFKALPAGEAEKVFRSWRDDQVKAAARQEEESRLREAAARRAEQAEREARDRQEKAAHSDAIAAYKALLTEVIREVGDGIPSWRSVQPKLGKDVQGRLAAVRDEREAEDLFRAHVDALLDKAKAGFRQLCRDSLAPLAAQVSQGVELPGALSYYQSAEEMMGQDARWYRLPEDLREREWYDTVDELLRKGSGAAVGASDQPAGRAARPPRNPPQYLDLMQQGKTADTAQDPAYMRAYGSAAAQAPEPAGPRPAPELSASVTARAAAAAAAAVAPAVPATRKPPSDIAEEDGGRPAHSERDRDRAGNDDRYGRSGGSRYARDDRDKDLHRDRDRDRDRVRVDRDRRVDDGRRSDRRRDHRDDRDRDRERGGDRDSGRRDRDRDDGCRRDREVDDRSDTSKRSRRA